MFENYLATNQDLEMIEKALHFVWRKELDFIFKERDKIANTLVISYDAKLMYLWVRKGSEYSLLKIPHHLKINDDDQIGWRANLKPYKLFQLLPKKWQVYWFESPKISGGLFYPFIKLQKKKRQPFNPYTTKESYLATILHEFGHVYFNLKTLWWFAPQTETLNYLEKAKKLYQKQRVNIKNFKLRIPIAGHLSELFAFCTEYTAASIFWPEHKKNLDRFFAKYISKIEVKEKKRDPNVQDSVLQKDSHLFSAIIGRILIERYPKSWPKIAQSYFLNL
jgi:hypothetical protein